MKKKLFIIAVLAIGMAACLGSCKKKTVEPTTDPDPTAEYVCTHDSLIHVMAVEPTAEENGCIEHYKCAYCLATFADAQATTSIDSPILWATNYVIDKECIAETQFAEYAGDESYFYRAVINTNDDMGDDGTLISDYTGWENWSEAQWQAYWELIHEYHVGWGGEVELVSENRDLLKDPFGNFLSKVILNDKDGSVDDIIKPFFEDDPNEPFARIEAKLDTIMRKLDSIQASIKELSDQIRHDTYKRRMDARNEQLSKVSFLTKGYFEKLLNVFKKRKTVPFSKLPQSAVDSIYNITDQWYNQHAVNVEYETYKLLTTFNQDWATDLNMPSVYDAMIYLCVPWEHEGYAQREMARAIDVVIAAEAYLMDVYYHRTHNNSFDDSKFRDMNKAMTGYAIILDNNPVIHNHHYFRCQIPGAEVMVEKKLKYLNCREYLDVSGYETIWMTNDGQLESWRKWLLPNGGVGTNWPNIVYKYYAQKYPSDVNNESFFYDKLLKVGFTNIDQSHKWVIVTDCGCEQHGVPGVGNYAVKMFQYYRHLSKKNHDYLGYHTAINKKDGKLEFSQAIYEMNFYGLDHEIDNKGSHINVSYYGIELYNH